MDIKPGIYRHFKGNRYEVIGLAKHSETMEPMVVYRALYGEHGLWVRPAAMWNETVEKNGVAKTIAVRMCRRGGLEIKETLTKLTFEVHLDWTKLLPIVLLKVRALPGKPLELSPFGVMYGRPRLPPGLPPEPPPIPSFLHSPLLAELHNAL